MCQLVESICVENKQMQHIELHNERLNRSGKALWGWVNEVNLSNIIEIPQTLTNDRYKCRVITNGSTFNVEFSAYQQRKVDSFKVLHNNNIDYSFKTTNRMELDEMFSLRNGFDDIIIVKNGFITDSWAANLILFDGDKWVTPSTPLLKGIQREYLLSINFITEKIIKIQDLKNFTHLKQINAMIDFERAPSVDVIRNIHF